MIRIIGLILVCSLFPAAAMAADSYYIGLRDGVDVRDRPAAQASVLGHLPRLTDVRLIKTDRAWSKISSLHVSRPLTGWVPSGAVRKRYQPSAAQKSSNSFFSGFSSWFNRDTTGGQQTAVLGVRGLDEEAGASTGQASEAGVAWMEKLGVSNSDVAAFVEQGGLNP
ncbi:MAG TPA: SH3 domain-containing protein [Mariprofundaceae bacterium]|nr:SH3 domain-containing protein [Mariprofundaceae bacterium]